MSDRAVLAAEARELVDEYRHISSQRPSPPDLGVVGLALGRALAALESSGERDMPQVAAEIAAARRALERVRHRPE
jgi:hypothetical protein